MIDASDTRHTLRNAPGYNFLAHPVRYLDPKYVGDGRGGGGRSFFSAFIYCRLVSLAPPFPLFSIF